MGKAASCHFHSLGEILGLRHEVPPELLLMEGETDGLEWKGGTRATKCAHSAQDWLWLSQIPAWLPYKLTWPLTVKTREHLIKPTFKKKSIYHGCARISDQENQTQTACKRGPSFSLTWAKILTWDARGVPLFSVCKDRRVRGDLAVFRRRRL